MIRIVLATVATLIICVALVAWPVSPSKPIVTPVSLTPASVGAPATTTPFLAKFANHLLALNSDGDPKAYDDSKLAGVKYVAFYYSASWCPPCRAFTPDLVSFYNGFKPSHPNFELIFVNADRSDGDMINYMKGDSMPWPAVWYADIQNPDLNARQFCGPGIPCLVLVDSNGNVLSDSFRNGNYVGPQQVVDDISSMVK
jgi:nucleoredoxin